MDENLPEYAIIINKLSKEFDDEIDNANLKIKELEKENEKLKQKYEPQKDNLLLIHEAILRPKHNTIAKAIHSLNKGNFRCISLKKKLWEYKENDEWCEMENEIFIKKSIDDAITVFQNEINKITTALSNDPENVEYVKFSFYFFNDYDDHFSKIINSLESSKTKSFILRELRELFYFKI